MIILAIETSCDETAASVIKFTEKPFKIEILSNVVSSQIQIHRAFGGIVPEVAARVHLEKILPVLKQAFANWHEYGHKSHQFAKIRDQIREYSRIIDLIAVTNGPGLITSLLVGVEVAKTLAYIWQKPLMPINHLEGHIYACFASQIPNSKFQIPNLFPAVCLIVSGGHTELVLMKDHGRYEKIGQTRDDAAGECFDKTAKLLNLGYPGGPAIAAQAAKYRNIEISKYRVKLPRPMINSNDFDFSFSGLKTAVLYKVKSEKRKAKSKEYIRTMCAEIQQAAVDVLVAKTIKAAREFKSKSVILCGGVAANSALRQQLETKVNNLITKPQFWVPPKNLCTDNAAMIGLAGYFKFIKTQEHKNIKTKNELSKIFNWRKIKVDPNLEIPIFSKITSRQLAEK